MKLLLVASDPMEFTGILAHSSNIHRLALASDWARAATLNGHELTLVANGAGPRRASEAVDAAVASLSPDAIVSTGFCGALDETLGVADIVVGTRIEWDQGSARCATWPGGHHGIIRSVDHVAQTAEEKRKLGSTGASAVEMEAAGVAERAEVHRIPLYCVRAVTDLSDETLANNFNASLRPDGHFDTMLILLSSLRHPLIRLPELIRLRRRCGRAARALGEFLAVCRF